MQTNGFFHSVTLDKDSCMGCTHCVKRCPTEAIRVRDGKARIIKERCIDCGECIRVCPHHAKKVISDPLSSINKFRYKIALPAPALYGQFNHLDDPDILLTALKHMGFDMVYEVSRAAELVSSATRHLMKDPDICPPKPVISSACPAVLRLIRVRFPSLLEHVLPVHAPVEMAARYAKAEAHAATGIPIEEIGAVFISPCPAKCASAKASVKFETFTYGELDTDKYAKLDFCPYCAPALRRAEIDKVNEAHAFGNDHDPVLTAARMKYLEDIPFEELTEGEKRYWVETTAED